MLFAKNEDSYFILIALRWNTEIYFNKQSNSYASGAAG